MYLLFIRLIAPPIDGYVADLFLQNKRNGTLYKKLFKNNMNGTSSFMSAIEALKLIENHDKIAYMDVGDPVRAYKQFHCKVRFRSG